MLAFVVRRSLRAGLVLLLMSVLLFIGVYVVGNPIDILVNPQAAPQERERAIAALGLDRPLWGQYVGFVSGTLRGDLGASFVHRVPALGLVFDRLPATLELAVVAMLFAIALGVPLGLWAGLRPGAAASRAIGVGALVGSSLPTFWAALMLIMLFSVMRGWLPASGRGPTTLLCGVPVSFLSLQGWRHLILPAGNLALFSVALLIRLARDATRETMLQDYVRFARAKGITHARLVGVHVLRNALLPVAAVIGLESGAVIGFAMVTETIFAWPGVGKLLVDSINHLDRPTIVAYLLVVVLLLVLLNLIADIACSALDPRLRLREAGE